jgi:arsenite methyltransferase
MKSSPAKEKPLNSDRDIKELVKRKYGDIARSAGADGGCGCGPSCCDPGAGVVFADSYADLQGYNPEADLSLGCGLPTETAGIEPGQTVLDLGSGAGNDAFVARALTGPSGRVIGLDLAPEMVDRARAGARRLGADNVEFILGEIEAIPLPDHAVDTVISNCVLNLVPDKARAFAEIYRVLRPGGHFSISDVVLAGELPARLAEAAALYVGCVAGALQRERYLEIIAAAGFTAVTVHKEKPISLPDELVAGILGPDGLADYKGRGVGIFSITVSATRP